MDIFEKLEILSAAARYDASCASSGSRRRAKEGGTGNAASCGVCHSWSDDGRCISLLKILFSNHCIYDCAYCANRSSNLIKRASFTVDEVVNLTMNFYKRNYIEGLFLSSGVFRSPDYTMEQLISVAKKLRLEQNFNGYIHMKAIPGATQELVRQAGLYTDRLSVNIELPSEVSLKKLAPQKNKKDILGPMNLIAKGITEFKEERKKRKKIPLFVPAGQSTQLIVGASPENDWQIINLSSSLYGHFKLKRVYYSAFVPVNEDSRLLQIEKPDMLREHRLYQADWLVRLYGFQTNEILTETNPSLDREIDPKTSWALRNPQFFPVDVNRADYDTLLRVPGIGFTSASRIISTRRFAAVRFEDLRKLGVVMKRAQFFITCGRDHIPRILNSVSIREQLVRGGNWNAAFYQPELFG